MSMYVGSSACVSQSKRGERERFRIDSGVRQGYIMSPLAVHCISGWSDKGGEDVDGKEGSELSRGWERVKIACPLVCR